MLRAYQLLTQLLICEPLQVELLKYLPKLRISALQLRQTALGVGRHSRLGQSGMVPAIIRKSRGPKFWSTACVYDFAHVLGRTVAEAVRRALFDELKRVYHVPRRGRAPRPDDFAPDFLDAKLKVSDEYGSLKETLRDRFVLPIEADKANIANGGRLKSTTPMSAILFGPPGTSKTQLAKLISQYLGWPILAVDPSYLVQDGMGRLYLRANRLFSVLAMAEQVVVLLDEFDEMGRVQRAPTSFRGSSRQRCSRSLLLSTTSERSSSYSRPTMYRISTRPSVEAAASTWSVIPPPTVDVKTQTPGVERYTGSGPRRHKRKKGDRSPLPA